MKEHKFDYVALGHHKDDLSENVFNNVMRGNKNIIDLSVIKCFNNIMNVNIIRPLLSFIKKEIYFISNKYKIPYFKDTTPNWSCRGVMRNKIFPICSSLYSNSFMKHLVELGHQSDELSIIVKNIIIDPIIKSLIIDKYGIILPKTRN